MKGLMLHKNTKTITLEQLLEKEQTPEWKKRWEDKEDSYLHIPYSSAITTFHKKALSLGFPCPEIQIGTTDTGSRMFAVMYLENKEETQKSGEETGMVLGIRNSHDKTFSLQVSFGSQVFVCDNLAFNAWGKMANIIKSRHNRKNTDADFGLGLGTRDMVEFKLSAMADQLLSVAGEYRETAAKVYKWMKETPITDDEAKLLLWQVADAGALPDGDIRKAYTIWKKPPHKEFEGEDNLWGIYNAITSGAILGKKELQQQGDAHYALNKSGLFLPPGVDDSTVVEVKAQEPESNDLPVPAFVYDDSDEVGEPDEEEEEEEYDIDKLPM